MRKLIVFGLLLQFFCAAAQSNMVFIQGIDIEGNRRTRDEIVLRELKFHEGDSVAFADLDKLLEESEQFIMNTGLFNRAAITFKSWEGQTNKVQLLITLEESWYLYPIPIFELADRNFNVWWVEQKRSLDRLNFGVEFTHLNFSGRRDKLKLTAKYGYTRNYGLRYSLPYINKQQTIGLAAGISFSQNREINYATSGNKQIFYRDSDKFLYKRLNADAALTYRPALQATHIFLLSYHYNQIAEEIAQDFNPDFFLQGRYIQRYLSAAYVFTYENRDVRPYPMKGNYVYFSVEKDGLGFSDDRNALTMHLGYEHYLRLGRPWSLGGRFRVKTSLIRDQQPYNDNRAMGFGRHYLHGYEYYVVDGLDMAYAKTLLRWQFLDHTVNFGKVMPLQAFRRMPVKLFLTLNNDFGFVNDPYATPDNALNNRLLWGAGLGLDVVLFFDKVIQIEYSVNHLWETGLFLHLNMNI